MSNYKRRNSYDLFLDYVLEQQDKILELSCELENAEELILDNYLEINKIKEAKEIINKFKEKNESYYWYGLKQQANIISDKEGEKKVKGSDEKKDKGDSNKKSGKQ